MKRLFSILAILVVALSCSPAEVEVPNAEIVLITFNGRQISESAKITDAPLSGAEYVFMFNKELKASGFDSSQLSVSGVPESQFEFSVSGKNLTVRSKSALPSFTEIKIRLYSGKNWGVNILYDYSFSFVTEYDPSDKFERISDDELFEKVQNAAFRYFWDYAHPVSGLARERFGSGNTVTIGGSGFGIMTIPVAIERGWITRDEGAQRALKSIEFLYDKAERFHGAWPHWIDGETGKTIPFSTYDNGADLVETAFMIQGLIALKHYFNGNNGVESSIVSTIDKIWKEVEWDWFRQNDQNKLYWHWSSNYGWKMNMPISGWNEALIVYVLAAGSPTHSISKAVYDEGWAGNGSITNDGRGPMFFAHYSFMGLDPRKLSDRYFDYWEMNVAHATKNHDYCASKGTDGYSDSCWGLTASDYSKGYTASSIANDKGTIAPTAALASFPYVPEQSRKAMEYFYYKIGDRLWGDFGFKDAFSIRDRWFADSYIAIDEGPICVMMENYRTGLLWNCFMQDSDVQNGLSKLGFSWK